MERGAKEGVDRDEQGRLHISSLFFRLCHCKGMQLADFFFIEIGVILLDEVLSSLDDQNEFERVYLLGDQQLQTSFSLGGIFLLRFGPGPCCSWGVLSRMVKEAGLQIGPSVNEIPF